MAHPDPKPAEKISATRTHAPKLEDNDDEDHEEHLIDEAVDESFPASDPPAIAHPSSTLAVKRAAEAGRQTPAAEPDPAKTNVQPRDEKKK
jgi:hypothetical protein